MDCSDASGSRVVPLQHYRDYTGDIDSMVPEVRIGCFGFYWPATCPREDAQEVVVGQDRCGDAKRKYIYTFENAASGRKFEVVLGCTQSTQQEGEEINRDEEWFLLTGATLRLL